MSLPSSRPIVRLLSVIFLALFGLNFATWAHGQFEDRAACRDGEVHAHEVETRHEMTFHVRPNATVEFATTANTADAERLRVRLAERLEKSQVHRSKAEFDALRATLAEVEAQVTVQVETARLQSEALRLAAENAPAAVLR